MLARAVANECNASFLAIGISEILSMWQGESERNLALMFEKARAQKPCVMFFDELDALAFARSKASSDVSRKIVNEFLSQLDGFDSANDQVLILAATNMPWDVDPAMKRPGRLRARCSCRHRTRWRAPASSNWRWRACRTPRSMPWPSRG
jgi:SpoVK/Ycf46/Vps4 family AAA+-type ATPase